MDKKVVYKNKGGVYVKDETYVKNDHSNAYVEGLKRFIGKEVFVKDQSGESFRGLVRAINFTYLNLILDSDEGLVIIKNPSTIRIVKKVSV